MKKLKKIQILSIFALMISASFVFAGSLNPSAPPASTMKPLDQIEPRIPITSLPITITTPGSYYLTSNLSTTTTAITVEANNVTIDLNGFTLTGNGTDNHYGVTMWNRSNIEIKNGTIQNFYEGIIEPYTNGKGHKVVGVRAIKNVVAGIHLVSSGNIIKDCTVMYNGIGILAGATRYGIYAGSRSIVTGNQVSENCTEANTGTAFGIMTGDGAIITGNTVCTNAHRAIVQVFAISTGNACVIKDNVVYDNAISCTSGYNGINAYAGSTLIGNSVYLNGTGSSGGTLLGVNLGPNCLADQNVVYNNAGTTQMNTPSNCVVTTSNKY